MSTVRLERLADHECAQSVERNGGLAMVGLVVALRRQHAHRAVAPILLLAVDCRRSSTGLAVGVGWTAVSITRRPAIRMISLRQLRLSDLHLALVLRLAIDQFRREDGQFVHVRLLYQPQRPQRMGALRDGECTAPPPAPALPPLAGELSDRSGIAIAPLASVAAPVAAAHARARAR